MEIKTGSGFESMRRMLQIAAVGGVLVAAAIMYAAVVNGRFSTPLELFAPSAQADAVIAAMPAGLQYEPVMVQTITSTNHALAIPVAAVDATLAMLAAAILWLLSKVFVQAEQGRPFAEVNVSRMRTAAWLTVVAAVVGFYLKPFVMAWASSQVGDGSWSVQANFMPFFVAVVAFALAAIWKRGAELADLEEHTV